MKLLRITTVPISLDLLLTNQMAFMKSKGFDVLMVSSNGPELSKIITREGCKHITIPFTRQITPFKDLLCLIRLIDLIIKEKPDIVHSHTPKAGLLAMLAAKICRVKLRLHTVAGLPLMTASGFRKRLLIYMEKLTVWASHKTLLNSSSLRTYMINEGLADKNKLEIISKGSTNGIDLHRFSRAQLDPVILDELKSLINYQKDKSYLLCVGRMVRDKGIVEVVDAFTKLEAKRPQLNLILIGPMERVRKEELLPQRILDKIMKNPAITHLEWSDQVEYFLALADVFIQASHREGFPNVTLQAGAMECPIVCSDIPGNIDIVTDQKTGYYFKKGDIADMIDKINQVIDDKEKSLNMSRSLRTEVETFFDQDFIHQEIYNYYQQQLANSQ